MAGISGLLARAVCRRAARTLTRRAVASTIRPMTWQQLRYLGNVVITVTVLAILYLIFAHRYSYRPFDYLWQGYICPTHDYERCVDGIEAVALNVHYVDRRMCADRTELEASVEKIAESFADITIDAGFMYGCRRSEYHRSQLTPAQARKGWVIDDSGTTVPSPRAN